VVLPELPTPCADRFVGHGDAAFEQEFLHGTVAQGEVIVEPDSMTDDFTRFNHMLRQRVARLVHDALSFSKKLVNHIGAIKLFICHYNLTRAVA
jgi:hypothetical protein